MKFLINNDVTPPSSSFHRCLSRVLRSKTYLINVNNLLKISIKVDYFTLRILFSIKKARLLFNI